MEFDPILIARLLLAFAAILLIIFAILAVGLSVYVVALLVAWIGTGEDRYQRLAKLWSRILAIALAMSIIAGISLLIQFNDSWVGLSTFVGQITGPLLGYGMTSVLALTAPFLAILLFGWTRVPRWLLALASIMVAAGTVAASGIALAAYSWMQTPTGHVINDGMAVPLNWWAVIFNPSFPYRFAHVINASFLATSFVVLAVGARYRLVDRHPEQARIMIKAAVILVAILAPLQLLIGDLHGLNTLKYQPIKIAAMEAHWDSDKPVDFLILAWPDEAAETNRWTWSIPTAGSLVLTHRLSGQIIGLKDVAPHNRPPVKAVFFAFRIMMTLGLLMIAAALIGAWLLWCGMLFESNWYLRIAAHTWWCGLLAVVAGGVVTESGRQPWAVQGVLRAAEAATPLAAPTVPALLSIGSVIMFAFAIFSISRLIQRGPHGPTGTSTSRGTALASSVVGHDTGHEGLESRFLKQR
jgi:cytochrome bd ubiquinol oxidase subunit I